MTADHKTLHRELAHAHTVVLEAEGKRDRERDSAKTPIRSLLDQLEAKNAQIEAMRDAIKEAYGALEACSENIGSRYAKLSDDADAAIAKLKPLLP